VKIVKGGGIVVKFLEGTRISTAIPTASPITVTDNASPVADQLGLFNQPFR
jgi:hypothetical protein